MQLKIYLIREILNMQNEQETNYLSYRWLICLVDFYIKDHTITGRSRHSCFILTIYSADTTEYGPWEPHS